MIKAVVFDLDGTLLNTLDALSYCMSQTMKKLGLREIDKDHTRYFVGEGAKVFVERSLIYNGDKNLDLLDKAYSIYNDIFSKDCLRNVRPYKGIPELLKELKAMGVKLAVLSNKSQSGVEANINTIIGEGVFDLIYGERPGIPKKPDPTALGMLINELNILKNELLYVGDTATDMLTAKALGCLSVGVLWGYRDERELSENDADFIIKTPGEIGDIVRKINS